MYRRILVPTDGSQCAERALEHAIALAEKFDSEIHVLNIVDVRMNSTGDYYSSMIGKMREIGEENTDKLLEKINEKGIEGEKEVVPGIPHTEINGYANEAEIDLIVMGTHGRTGLNRLLIGSTAEKVVRTSEVPVMTVSAGRNEE